MFVPSVEAVRITIDLLNQYKDDESLNDALDPKWETISAEDFLERHFAENNYSDELQDTITEFFFKISRYRKYLDVIANKFMSSKTSWSKRNSNDSLTYIVFLYLLVFELNELTQAKIEDILISINGQKALSLLTFFKRKDIITKLYEWGCQIWDVDFVTDILKNALKRPLFEDVYKTLSIHYRDVKQNQIKELTTPLSPECLRRTTKKIVRRSEDLVSESSSTRIPVIKRFHQTPVSTYIKPIEFEKLEEQREKNRKEARMLWEESQALAFRCANTEKSEKFKNLPKKLEEEAFQERLKKLPPRRKIRPKKVPSPKKTAAVILREGCRLLKLEKEEIKRYQDLANGGFNSDLLNQWEEEIREVKYREHIEDIERKHLEGLLSYEEALLAKQKCFKRKKEKAEEFKKEKELWLKELEIWKQNEQKRLQEIVDKEKESEKGVKEAVEQMVVEKHKIVAEAIKESKALQERRIKEREEELRRKVQMIKEIKALQSLGKIRKKHLDLSETANLGFLCEMSITELKERLFILRIELQEELEKKRVEVKMKRECRKEMVDSYQELIESHRQITKEQKNLRQEIQAECPDGKKEMRRISPCLDELRRKLNEKRRQRLQSQFPA